MYPYLWFYPTDGRVSIETQGYPLHCTQSRDSGRVSFVSHYRRPPVFSGVPENGREGVGEEEGGRRGGGGSEGRRVAFPSPFTFQTRSLRTCVSPWELRVPDKFFWTSSSRGLDLTGVNVSGDLFVGDRVGSGVQASNLGRLLRGPRQDPTDSTRTCRGRNHRSESPKE